MAYHDQIVSATNQHRLVHEESEEDQVAVLGAQDVELLVKQLIGEPSLPIVAQ